MRRDAIVEGFWIFQDSECARCLCMQALHKVLNILEYGWIMPYGRVLNMFGNASQGFASGSKFARTQNMVRLWTCDGCTGWVILNKPDYALKMSQFLSNVEYDWIRWYIPKKQSPYMSEFWIFLMQYIAQGHCANYWALIETDVFRTLSNI